MKILNSIILLLFCAVPFVHAQDYRFNVLDNSSGLASNKTFSTISDEEGFIWISTDIGISRYDGRQIINYELDSLNEFRRGTFSAVHLEKGDSNQLWAISNTGLLYLYDLASDHFQLKEQFNLYVNKLFYFDNQRLLIGHSTGALVYDQTSNEITPLPEIESNVSAFHLANNQLYVGSREGVMIYNTELQYINNLKDTEKNQHWIPGDQRIESIHYQEFQHRLWIGSQNSGVYVYDLEDQSLGRVDPLLTEIDIPVRSILKGSNESILIGTDGAGLFEYDIYDDRVVEHYKADSDNEKSISSNATYHIYKHPQDKLFIATYRGGVNMLDLEAQKFYAHKHVSGSDGLNNNVVLSIVETKKGELSFGTDIGLSIWNKPKDEWRSITLSPNSGSIEKSALILAQDTDEDQNLWVGSYVSSLSKYTTNGYNRLKLDLDLPRFNIKSMLYHSSGKLVIGTVAKGILIIDKSGGVQVMDVVEPIDMEEFSSDQMLLVNRNGLALVDINTQTIEPIGDGPLAAQLGKLNVSSLLVAKDRQIWFGTLSNGVFKLDLGTSELAHFNISNGLASNEVFDLVEDLTGNIWVATALGLSKISDDQIDNYYQSDGLVSTDFNRNSSARDSDGWLYFGTNRGVIYFNPIEIRPERISKNLILTDFYLNHQRILPESSELLNGAINKASQLQLDHDQNSFSIDFTSVDFLHADQGNYTWTLEGFDDSWSIPSADNKATYTNLNPGDYTFRLKMVDQLGQSLAPDRLLQINIAKPFYTTFWAYMFYAAVILGLIVLLLYLNKLRIESRSSEDRLHFLIDMAHEIKTPLTLIKAPISDLVKQGDINESAKQSLKVALNSADKLHKQMMQFLDFKKIDLRKNHLSISEFDVIDLIQKKVFAFKVLADKKMIQIAFEGNDESFLVKTDVTLLDKIISNLLSNAIKYTPEHGKVTVGFHHTAKKWTISVRDTGIGISKQEQKKIFTLFYRTESAKISGSTGSGVGLVLASDLAKTLGGKLSLEHSSSEGSEFQLSIPRVLDFTLQQNLEEANLSQEFEEHELSDNGGILAKPKLLMVEDDADLLRYQKSKFVPDYQVITATNGVDALELIKKDPPDIIISDVMMPKMNGRQLCMNVKSNIDTSHIPFVLLSGQESKQNIQQGLDCGADDYILKPFEFEMLSVKIENLLKTRKAFREKFIAADEDNEYQQLLNDMDQKFLDEITAYVEQNISDPELSINHLCQSFGMSRTAFYHKLKTLVEMSPAEFIRTIRLKRAKKLLMNPANNISEVAYNSGFSDPKYFSTLFKKYFGKSPSNFVSEKARRA